MKRKNFEQNPNKKKSSRKGTPKDFSTMEEELERFKEKNNLPTEITEPMAKSQGVAARKADEKTIIKRRATYAGPDVGVLKDMKIEKNSGGNESEQKVGTNNEAIVPDADINLEIVDDKGGNEKKDKQETMNIEPIKPDIEDAEHIELPTDIEEEPVIPEFATKVAKKSLHIEDEKTIENLRKDIEESRKEYLEIDYKKNTALSRIRKFFGNALKETREGDNLEEDREIAYLRAHYDNNLFDLQKKLMAEAREKGASDEELSKLYIEFRTEQKITLASEHDNVKAEQKFKSRWGKIDNKLTGLSERYKKLELKDKLLISAAFMGATVLTAGTGAAFIVGGAVAARRVFMGLVTGYGAKKGLEKWGKSRDKSQIEKEKEKFLEKLKNCKTEEEKYALLNQDIQNIAIKDEENSINKIKNQDVRQNLAGITAGSAVAFSGQIAKFFSDYFGSEHIDAGNIKGVKLGNVDSHQDFDYDSINKSNYENYPDQPNLSISENPHEVLPNPGQAESITIEKGSNFWKAIEHKLSSVEPGTDHTETVRLAWRDGVSEYARQHNVSFDQAVEKLGKINSGTKFSMVHDTNGWHAHFEDKNIKFSGSPENLHEKIGDSSDVAPKSEIPSQDLKDVVPEPENPDLDKLVDQDLENQIKNSRIDMKVGMENLQGQEERLGGPYNPISGTEENLSNIKLQELDSKLHKLLVNKSILDGPIKSTVIEIKNNIFGKNAETFLTLKNENLAEIMKSEEAKEAFLKKIPKSGRIFFTELVKQVPPNKSDTMLKWLVRIAIEAKKVKG